MFYFQDAQAMYHLAICYEHGWGVERNEAKAADLYKSAGSRGVTDALYNLAVFHEKGFGGRSSDAHVLKLCL